MVASSTSAERVTADGETRLGEFTDLAATAVANAQARSELTASRARVVAASDEARRHIERDLHDGVQQRLVSLALGLRLAADEAAGDGDLRPQLSQIEEGLVDAVNDLRELSHGIHPAILSEGGLRPALTTLARRTPLPVEVSITGLDRLPEPIEVGVYYVVSETLTNVVKHAEASVVFLELEAEDSVLRISARDDGIGGADPGRGSGMLGLMDRVHALSGRIEITSPAGGGTSLLVTVPLGDTAEPSEAEPQ
jgi:signal transduction histidine kinase